MSLKEKLKTTKDDLLRVIFERQKWYVCASVDLFSPEREMWDIFKSAGAVSLNPVEYWSRDPVCGEGNTVLCLWGKWGWGAWGWKNSVNLAKLPLALLTSKWSYVHLFWYHSTTSLLPSTHQQSDRSNQYHCGNVIFCSYYFSSQQFDIHGCYWTHKKMTRGKITE